MTVVLPGSLRLIPYTPAYLWESIRTYFSRRRFYYSDGCPPIEITQNFSIPVVPPICNGTTADATCDTLGNITLTGVVVGEVAMDLLVYQLTWRHHLAVVGWRESCQSVPF
jgi:hypothetical protein